MKNRLQKAFSYDRPTDFRGNIKFIDNNHYNEFIKKLTALYETGTPQQINGVEKVTMNQTIHNKEFPLSEHDRITDFYVTPVSEDLQIPVTTEFGKYIWPFKRIQTKYKTILENSDQDVIHVKINYDTQKEVLYLTYNTNFQMATSITKIVEAYYAILALFSIFFEERSDELQQNITNFNNSIEFWKQVIEIEKCFDIKFCPQNITADSINNESIQDIEELYLTLIKGYVIRENRGITDFTTDTIPNKDIKTGQQFTLSFLSSFEINILGANLTVYTVNVAFNIIIESIELSETNKKYVLKAKDTDTSPMYISYKSFSIKKLQKNEMEKLTSDFNSNVIVYSNAKTINQFLKEKYS